MALQETAAENGRTWSDDEWESGLVELVLAAQAAMSGRMAARAPLGRQPRRRRFVRRSGLVVGSVTPAGVSETLDHPTVLVADDDAGVREMVREVLVDDGYEVMVAVNGLDAEERIEATPPNLILLDLHMPVVNGWQVHEWLKARGAHIPVVFMTAGERARREAERCHADAYLPKPFDLTMLTATVERFVARVA